MTIGQRIAERRKLLGISQESLGERMGVSRQAISKWEADGAIPEIDKLIALSKLFGVSVGWLLGTESEETKEEQETGLTEVQLKMVEQIVLRYQQAQQPQQLPSEPKRNPWPVLLSLACAVLALILSVVGLSKTSRQFPNYEYQLGDLTNAYSAIRSQLYELSDRLDELAEGEKLLSEFGVEYSALPDWETARIAFRAVSKNRQTGDTAYLSLWQNGTEKYMVECLWDGVAFSAEGNVAYGEYEAYFVQCRGESFQIQNVTEAFYELPCELEPVCDADVCEVGWDLKNGKLSLDALVIWLEPPWIMAQEEGLEWTKLDLVVKRNGQEIRRLDLQAICEDALELNTEGIVGFFETSQSVPVMPAFGTTEDAKDVRMLLERFEPMEFVVPELQAGDRIVLTVEGELNNGYSFEKDVYIIAF
jgi:transcriptional regulator with XRE-family HTH domain